MRSRRRIFIILMLGVLFVAVLLICLVRIGDNATVAWNWEQQYYGTQAGTPQQRWEAISFIGTILGIVLVIAFTIIWYRYRNERDPQYWCGGYQEIPDTFAAEGAIEGLVNGRPGGGKAAMAYTRDFHETAAAFLPPTKGQPSSVGFWKIY